MTGALDLPVITVKQPHASLIVSGIKPIENRGWTIECPRWLLIHAGMQFDHENGDALFEKYQSRLRHRDVYGAVVGVFWLSRIVEESPSSWALPQYRFHWVLTNARSLKTPVHVRGQQGPWRLDKKHSARLPAYLR